MRTPWTSVAASLGVAAWITANADDQGPLTHGGLAVVAVTLIGALVGVPLAGWYRDASRARPAIRTGAACVSVLLAAAVLAAPGRHLWGASPGLAVAAVGVFWLPTVFAPSRRAVIATVLLASMVAATGLGAPVLGRWTLLEPTWGHLTQWGPTALALGVLLADPLGAATRPAHPTRPWFTLGLGLAIVTGTTLTAALTRGAGGASLIPLAAGLAASVALNSDDLSAHPRQATLRAVRAVCGVVLTLALVVPVVPAVDLLWRSALPGALAVLALVAASALRGGARWSSLTVGVLLLASAAYAWPGVPDDVFSGVLIGAIASVIVWIVGSTALLRGRALEAA